MQAFVLLGLIFIGMIWTVRGGTSLRNSSSETNEAERTRQRRQTAGLKVLTQAERITFLAAHNKFRGDATGTLKHKQPPAANMKRMYWSAFLEASAQSWSKHLCETKGFGHGQTDVVKLKEFTAAMSIYGDFIGQNIFAWSDPYYKPYDTVLAYAKETVNYEYGPTGGKCVQSICGHYTQVMWADTFLVGCGTVVCNQGAWRFYSTCNYLPGGNMGGKPVYLSGTPCSRCGASDPKFIFGICDQGGKSCVPKDRCSPVKECTVVDKVNCLCSAAEYKGIVERLVTGKGPPIKPSAPLPAQANDKMTVGLSMKAKGKGPPRRTASRSSHAASPSLLVVGLLLLLLLPLVAVLPDQDV